MEQIGAYLKNLRERAGLSVKEAARRAEMSSPYLYQIEDERRRPSAKVLARLAGVYQVPVEDILRKAGFLPPVVLPEKEGESREERIQRAFEFVMKDPEVRAGSSAMLSLPTEAKLAIIRLYERAEGLRILPEEFV
ncbi:MAG: hypothetical protein KatS3mg024_0679 [Armatimonadota bacterium]|nr:MAG: hypothetical protein KatS3mg024_0679 [Armatimonadota bacterium]